MSSVSGKERGRKRVAARSVWHSHRVAARSVWHSHRVAAKSVWHSHRVAAETLLPRLRGIESRCRGVWKAQVMVRVAVADTIRAVGAVHAEGPVTTRASV